MTGESPRLYQWGGGVGHVLAVPMEMRTGTWEPSLRETVIIAEMWPRDNSSNSSSALWIAGFAKQNQEVGEDKLVGQRSGFDFAYTHCLRILG